MSERKVLNKYYPPDFNPNNIPRMKRDKNPLMTIRIMAPFNMRCNTCGEYIYKGKKFNSRKENVEDEFYLGLYIFRFYIRCPRCIAVISFKTDPENTDYTLEAGATRNFEASRTAEELAKKEAKEKEEEEANNPMKVLENRTKASQNEMAMLETLEELKDLNKRQANVDYESMVEKYRIYEEQLRQLQDDEDEKLIQSIFGEGSRVRRLEEDDDDDEDDDSGEPKKKINKLDKPTDILAETTATGKNVKTVFSKSSGSQSSRSKLMGLVKRKQTPKNDSTETVTLGNKSADDKSSEVSTPEQTQTETSSSQRQTSGGSTNKHSDCNDDKSADLKENGSNSSQAPPTGLGLLGAYSDSESNDSD